MYVFKAKSQPFKGGPSLVGVDRHEALTLFGAADVQLGRTTFLGEGLDACVMLPQRLKVVDVENVLQLRGVARCHGKEVTVWLLLDHQLFEWIVASEEMGERKFILNHPRSVTWALIDRRQEAPVDVG